MQCACYHRATVYVLFDPLDLFRRIHCCIATGTVAPRCKEKRIAVISFSAREASDCSYISDMRPQCGVFYYNFTCNTIHVGVSDRL